MPSFFGEGVPGRVGRSYPEKYDEEVQYDQLGAFRCYKTRARDTDPQVRKSTSGRTLQEEPRFVLVPEEPVDTLWPIVRCGEGTAVGFKAHRCLFVSQGSSGALPPESFCPPFLPFFLPVEATPHLQNAGFAGIVPSQKTCWRSGLLSVPVCVHRLY